MPWLAAKRLLQRFGNDRSVQVHLPVEDQRGCLSIGDVELITQHGARRCDARLDDIKRHPVVGQQVEDLVVERRGCAGPSAVHPPVALPIPAHHCSHTQSPSCRSCWSRAGKKPS